MHIDPAIIDEAEKQGLDRLIKLGFDQAQAALNRWHAQLETTQDLLQTAIAEHIAEVNNWSREISFKDLQQPRSISDVFVPLDIFLLPRRNRFSGEEVSRSVPLDDFLGENAEHIVIVGQPGAGKTTCVKHICQELLVSDRVSRDQNYPVLIKLRELNGLRTPKTIEDSTLIVEALQKIYRITLNLSDTTADDSVAHSNLRASRERAVLEIIESTRPLILLDGLDEITHKKKRDAVIEELRHLAPRVENARFILTSRTGEFNYYIERMHTFEVAPLTPEQIANFASGWLGKDAAEKFLMQVKNSPFWDTAIKPLTLAHLCAIYERLESIPERPKTVYKKIIRLLLEEWDQQRSVKRKSAYAGFDVDRKQEFLADLAYTLSTEHRTSTFSRSDLLQAFSQIHQNYSLLESDAQDVVDEVESHTGIVIQSATDLFEFSHKSLHEFLAASFIHGLPEIPANMIDLQLMPSELAIATALSTRPSRYFTKLVFDHFRKYRLSFAFVRTYVNRLLIERPDFEFDAEVGIAVLLLYSQYLHASITEADQLRLFIDDYLEEEFEKLGSMIKSRIRLDEVLKVYETFSHSFNGLGEQIWRLQKKAEPHGSFALFARSNILPETLWIRNSLLSPEGDEVESLSTSDDYPQ